MQQEVESNRAPYTGLLFLLMISALLLAARLGYLYLADADRFPITTVKVAASYEHVSHKQLETILAKHLSSSFFLLSVNQLQRELNEISWIDTAYVERLWPDTLKIKLVEKNPVAIWDKALMTVDGRLFNEGHAISEQSLPELKGPEGQQLEVLQVYEKLSKILSEYGLNASGLQLRDNQSWVLLLEHGATVYLGKKEIEERLLRFCKAYPAVFAQKAEQLASVDLRYPRGMAVQWKQQMGR